MIQLSDLPPLFLKLFLLSVSSLPSRTVSEHACGHSVRPLSPLSFFIFHTSPNTKHRNQPSDLEKRQHRFASGELKPLAPRVIQVPGPGVDSNTEIELPPRTEASILNTQENSDKFMRQRPLGVAGGDEKEHMAGEWTS